jgi:RNA polymerase nonessential primary-like sigma factor
MHKENSDPLETINKDKVEDENVDYDEELEIIDDDIVDDAAEDVDVDVEAELSDVVDDVKPAKASFKPGELSDKDVDATRIYLKEIEYSPLLTPEQEVEFGRLVRKGDPFARGKMIESNLRLVVKIARRYMNRGLALLDLIEEGNLGLIRAVEKFDPEKGFRFSTYATWWIRQTIERGLMNQTRTIRLPIHVIKELNVYLRAARQLQQNLEREPTTEEVAESLDKPLDEVKKMFGLNERMTSVDMPMGKDNDSPLLDVIPDEQNPEPPDLLQTDEVNEHIEVWLQELDQKQQEVVIRRFGLRGHERCTLEEVGNELGVTRERARQIQMEALKRLRRILESKGFSWDVLMQ